MRLKRLSRIMSAHRDKTSCRAANHRTVLAIQDTSYLVYTNHSKTKGLGKLSLKKGKNIDNIFSRGIVMHTCLAITTKGAPLGLFDQKTATQPPGTMCRLSCIPRQASRYAKFPQFSIARRLSICFLFFSCKSFDNMALMHIKFFDHTGEFL